MTRLIRCSVCVALMVSLASAATAATLVHAKTDHPPSLFFARPKGDRGPATAYDMTNGRVRFNLPSGILSADGGVFAATAYVGDTATRFDVFDANSGDNMLYMPLTGRWVLQAVSSDGRFAALAGVPSEQDDTAWTKSGKWQTEMQVIDTVSRRPKHTLKLDGNFEAEAISANGTSLFLVEHLPAAKPDHYAIRWYDLKNERLVADPLRSKTADEIMSGYAWGGAASADGDWLFTLYISTNRKVAFIHMLNTREGFTVCVDLPSGAGDFEALKGYALAYSPKRQTVYAMNPRLGVVAEVKLGDYKLNGNKFVANKIANFKPIDDENTINAPAVSALSPDQHMLFFGQGTAAFAYDTAQGKLRQSYRADRAITGLAASENGMRVWVAQQNAQPQYAQPQLFDASSGRRIAAADL